MLQSGILYIHLEEEEEEWKCLLFWSELHKAQVKE